MSPAASLCCPRQELFSPGTLCKFLSQQQKSQVASGPSLSICLQCKPSQCAARVSHAGVPRTVGKENPRDVYCACQRPESLFLLFRTSFKEEFSEHSEPGGGPPQQQKWKLRHPVPQQYQARNIKDTGPSWLESGGHLCLWGEPAGALSAQGQGNRSPWGPVISCRGFDGLLGPPS